MKAKWRRSDYGTGRPLPLSGSLQAHLSFHITLKRYFTAASDSGHVMCPDKGPCPVRHTLYRAEMQTWPWIKNGAQHMLASKDILRELKNSLAAKRLMWPRTYCHLFIGQTSCCFSWTHPPYTLSPGQPRTDASNLPHPLPVQLHRLLRMRQPPSPHPILLLHPPQGIACGERAH